MGTPPLSRAWPTVAAERLTTEGFGDTKPVAGNS